VTKSPPCTFCRVVSGELSAKIVYQNDLLTAIRDSNPQAPTHILLIPNRHIPGLNELSEGDGAVLSEMLLAASVIAHDEGLADSGYRIVVNQGRDAGQSVFHLHIHLLGGRRMSWPPG
jgi:histidine triad (HIT) family protein